MKHCVEDVIKHFIMFSCTLKSLSLKIVETMTTICFTCHLSKMGSGTILIASNLIPQHWLSKLLKSQKCCVSTFINFKVDYRQIKGGPCQGPPFCGKNLDDYIGNHWSMMIAFLG